jgi:tetratricopeptide (TPR) repeat protein
MDGWGCARNDGTVLIFIEPALILPIHLMRFPIWLALALLAAGCSPSAPPRDARLQAPTELAALAEKQKSEKIFTNPRARALLEREKLAFVPPTPQDATALVSPPLWRKLDRAQRFDAVLLAGPSSEIAPLLGHLASSPDFALVHLDNWGAFFVRGVPTLYQPPDPGEAAKNIPTANDRGLYLAQMALMLDAVNQLPSAKDYLAKAIKTAPDDPGVHVCAAAQALTRKHYPDALKHAERALKLHPGDVSALEIEARALAGAGASDAAWKVATELKSLAPDDPGILFLHARLSNAAHAYGKEQESLERLIELAEKQKLPTTDYRVYLGQCFARQGLARPALRQLELALADPAISKQQREDLTNAVETVRARAGELAP